MIVRVPDGSFSNVTVVWVRGRGNQGRAVRGSGARCSSAGPQGSSKRARIRSITSGETPRSSSPRARTRNTSSATGGSSLLENTSAAMTSMPSSHSTEAVWASRPGRSAAARVRRKPPGPTLSSSATDSPSVNMRCTNAPCWLRKSASNKVR